MIVIEHEIAAARAVENRIRHERDRFDRRMQAQKNAVAAIFYGSGDCSGALDSRDAMG
jgi:hypothetical protein